MKNLVYRVVALTSLYPWGITAQKFYGRNQYIGNYSQDVSYPTKYYAMRGGVSDAIIKKENWGGYTGNYSYPRKYYGERGGLQPEGPQKIAFQYNIIRQKDPSLMHATTMVGEQPFDANYFKSQSLLLIDLFAPKQTPLSNAELITRAIQLIQSGAYINQYDKLFGFTPFYMALTNYAIDESVVQFLLNNGANVFYQDMYAGTALTYAGKYDRSPVITKLILDAGGDPTHSDFWFNTPINYFLQSAKENQDAGDIAAYNNSIRNVYLLLDALYQHKQDIQNYQNTQRSLVSVGDYRTAGTAQSLPSTTLSWLAYVGDLDLMKRFMALLGDMVNENINQAPNGLTAYDWAGDNAEIKQFLRAYGGQKGIFLKTPATRR